MISSEVERTLVKSPPELWTELSNPHALARHLGEFGDIRITRVEPEHAVEWQAGDTAGTVRIKPSGWGTKVTLTATREIGAAEQAVEDAASPQPEPEREFEPEAEPEAEAGAHAVAPAPEPEREPARDSIESSQPEPAAVAPPPVVVEPPPRLGFFRRLLGGGRGRNVETTYVRYEAAASADPEPEPEPERAQPDPFAAVRVALAPHTVAAADPFSTPRRVEAASASDSTAPSPESLPDRPCVQTADVSADLRAAEEVAAEEVAAVLTSVLDRLGAAHHRPFSRA
jgi:hypothetical protein